ncbi:sulfite exporter TauE/SafE family protein [Iamia majanohamensis]|uniref:Probable membrane transporter protein n=1 Tax=Iamia majanohamensis TaxID=467976 RepID=A0AAE9YEC1_9ACTN|nr:sulfite exporter TauE/SafE family protein [Iamia majanohamensis]WCO66326.1 sulfite exporter TauE/SafE family protein [Iamia majanohamensis]
MRGLLASPLGLLIGLSLGALGGGGSILAVPALVYGAGENATAATTTSLLVVGVASLLGMGSHWKAGRVRLGPGLVFGVTGLGGSAIGTALNRHVDPDVLLLTFSVVMVIAAAGMWKRGGSPDCIDDENPETIDGPGPSLTSTGGPGSTGNVAVADPPRTERPTRIHLDARTIPKILLAGTIVGLMTGFFGVGGGFVIVPALVLTLGFTMPDAVGTSLVVIALNAAMALALRAGSVDIQWDDALPFVILAVIGTLLGRRLADRLNPVTLTRGFVGLLVLVAIYTAASSTVALT